MGISSMIRNAWPLMFDQKLTNVLAKHLLLCHILNVSGLRSARTCGKVSNAFPGVLQCFKNPLLFICSNVQCNRANSSPRKENALFIFPEKVSHINMIMRMSPLLLWLQEADTVLLKNLEYQIQLQFLQDDVNATKERHKKVGRRTQLLFSIFSSNFSKALLWNCHLVAVVYTEWQTTVLKACDTVMF